MNSRSLRASLSVLAFSFLSACNVKLEPHLGNNVDDQIRKKLKSWAPTCAAVPETGTVNSNTDFLVTITAKEGVAPYALYTSTDTWASSTVITKRFSNSGAQDATVTETVSIRDSLGLTAVCQFSVVVRPQNATPSTLACNMTATPESPVVGQNTALSITASGGTGSYQFETLTLSANSVVVTPLVSTSTTQATAMAAFYTVGMNSAQVKVKDSSGANAICSKAISVRPVPSVTLTASPSTTVSADSAVTLVASQSGFLGAPTFVFTSTDSHAVISSGANTATVRSWNNSPRSFSVKVRATHSNGESAEATVFLTFSGQVPLVCSLTHTAGSYGVNQDVTFEAKASTNEALEITYFDAGGGTLTALSQASRTIRFASTGTKRVYAIARSLSRNVTCNAGALLEDSVAIAESFSCTVVTNPSLTYLGEVLEVKVTVPGFHANFGARIIDIITSWEADAHLYSGPNGLSAEIYFENSGLWPVRVVVEDFYGRRTSCSTTHRVWGWWW